MFEPEEIRNQFPFFDHHPSLAYLDNAATTQKPQGVIEAVANFYSRGNANIHRGLYEPAVGTSRAYEAVRSVVASFIGARATDEIVYTTGTTAGINLVAYSFLRPRLNKGDEVLISAMEHHANLIPWQMACREAGAALRIIPMNQQGELDLAAFQEMLNARTRLVAVVHISNTLGTINPVSEIVDLAHRQGVPVLIDVAQSAAHYPIDVQAWDVDFLVFSGHKLFGPTGIGILYGKEAHLERMAPLYFGGDMIREVTWEQTNFAPPPRRFEAGTTHIAGVLGLGEAISFISGLDRSGALVHLQNLGDLLTDQLRSMEGVKIIGQAAKKTAIVSFTLEGVHPHDVSTFLAAEGVAVRAGHHCTQPVMDWFGIPATTRASFSIYNLAAEVDRLVNCLAEIKKFFS